MRWMRCELEDESSDGGGGVATALPGSTQAVSAQRVPLTAGGGRGGGGGRDATLEQLKKQSWQLCCCAFSACYC